MVGKTISRYRVVEELGAGGMGTVYKAEDEKLQRTVALKFLARYAAVGGSQDDQKSRFLHEARAAAALDHPNICGIYEIDEVDGQTFLAMPFLEGQPLDKRIEEGPLKLRDALDIAIQTADALEEAHSKGVVHRDIKPANIMILDRERGNLQVKLMDFGLARLAQASRLTQEGSRLGTAAYMSPEQTQGEAVDARTDLWSLGVVLYEMVAGTPPFPAEYEQALFYGILNEQPEPLTAVRTGVPMELERIANKCMAKAPAQRYQTATDLLVDLKALRAELADSRTRPANRSGSGAVISEQPQAAMESEPAQADEGAAHKTNRPGWLGVVAAAAIAAFATWLAVGTGWGDPAPVDDGGYKLRRVSWDGDLAAFPALSVDGTLLAYASDLSGRGDLDIWVQQVAGEKPRRITDSPADDLTPSFSPDGSQIVFSRRPGGVYTIPALGGDPYLVAEDAYSPSFGPKGKRVAYLRDDELFYSPVSMGDPVQLLADMNGFGPPLWRPDGEALLVYAVDERGKADWTVAPLDGSAPTRLNAVETFRSAGMALPPPARWAWGGDDLILGDRGGDLIKVRVDLQTGAIGTPRPMTFGTGFEAMPSASGTGLIAFAAVNHNRNLWGVNLDAKGIAKGSPIQLTVGAAAAGLADVTADDRRLVYISQRPQLGDIWTRDAALGGDTNLTADDADQSHPILGPAGERIVYLTRNESKAALYVRPFQGGLGREVCEDCGTPTSWSPDGRYVLYESGAPLSLWTLDLESGEKTKILSSPQGPAWQGRFSPDGQSIVFRFENEGESGLFASRFAPGNGAVASSEWVRITNFASDTLPAWSVSGDRLYFISQRDGSRDIWMVRLKADLSPSGRPALLHRFPLTRYSLDVDDERLAVSRNRVIFSMTELRGSIWLLEPQAQD